MQNNGFKSKLTVILCRFLHLCLVIYPFNKWSILQKVPLYDYLVIAFVFIIISCGSSSDSSKQDPNIGWLSIDSAIVILNDEGESYAYIEGTAFESYDYIAHKCAGLCCLLCYYDNSYPGVDVWCKNQSNGINVKATSRYGTATNWDHIWNASIPIILGNNDIVITAVDPANNYSSDSIIVEYLPPAPNNILADSSDEQISLMWGNVSGVDSYNIYWSTVAGVTKSTGTKIPNVTSPYVHSGLTNGVTHYYVHTSVFNGVESEISNEILAVPGAPERPDNVMAETINGDIIISWNNAPTATSYNLYWANESNVTKANGNLIPGVTNPYIHSDLIGIPHYYVITASNIYGESLESFEVEVVPQLPPVAPTNLSAAYRPYYLAVDIEWKGVPGISFYKLYRCNAWTILPGPGDVCCEVSMCQGAFGLIYTGADTLFVDWTLEHGQAYRYHVIAVNSFGQSNPSEDVAIYAYD